jgi:hypothetical protein
MNTAPAAYGPAVTDSGAEKLSTSQVAPVVAAGRGYETILGTEADPDSAANLCKKLAVDLRSKGGIQIKRILATSPDTLLMPWYKSEDVSYARQHGRDPSVASRQLRPNPSHLQLDEDGRANKYVLLANNRNVLGVHPSTPHSWLTDPGSFFITEGMLKGDSALSALLAHLGVTDTELDSSDPTLLTQIMERVTPEDRVLIVSVVGVSSWHQNPEWDSFNFRDKEVWVAFDGDIGANIQVWNQARKMEQKISSKYGTSRFLVIPDPTGDKLGVDDFFAAGNSWADLAGYLDPVLPDKPVGDDHEPGEWSIDDHTRQTLEWVANPASPGVHSKPVYEFAGRVVSTLTKRSATEEEMGTGVLDEEQWDLNPATVQIEVTWIDADYTDQKGSIVGSSDMLCEPPDRWTKSKGSLVSPNISLIPAWPPKPKWAEAIKDHRREDIEQRAVWDHMGWVPTKTGKPVFIVGKQVIGSDGEFPAKIVGPNGKLTTNPDRPADPGVDENTIHGAEKFGVHVPESPDEVLDALEAMLNAYEATWTDPRVAALVIATAMRPVVPIPSRSPIFISGGQGTGKSWTATAIMGFWQAYPGAWKIDDLPGGSADTMYATENAVSRVPIWVSDDLAPSASRQQAEAAEAKLSDIIRLVFNGSAKARMFADGTARKALSPRALFIATAENPLSVNSVMSRVVHLRTTKNYLGNIDAVDTLLTMTNTLSTITAFAILDAAEMVETNGWKSECDRWKALTEHAKGEAKKVFSTDDHAKRHTKIAADIALGLFTLISSVEGLRTDFPERAAAILARLAPMEKGIYSLVAESYQDQLQKSPGQNLLRALQTLLKSGQAHLSTPGEGGVPILDTDDLDGASPKVANQALGWQLPTDAHSDPRPSGTAIGHVVRPRGGGEPHALFDPEAAFDLAKKNNPTLIPPGMGPSSSWSSMWDEGLAKGTWARKGGGQGGHLKPTVLVTVLGTNLIGVPVPLSVLLGQAGEESGGNDTDTSAGDGDDGWDDEDIEDIEATG